MEVKSGVKMEVKLDKCVVDISIVPFNSLLLLPF